MTLGKYFTIWISVSTPHMVSRKKVLAIISLWFFSLCWKLYVEWYKEQGWAWSTLLEWVVAASRFSDPGYSSLCILWRNFPWSSFLWRGFLWHGFVELLDQTTYQRLGLLHKGNPSLSCYYVIQGLQMRMGYVCVWWGGRWGVFIGWCVVSPISKA